ncbi:hypothetical protein EIP86_010654 [Pleurotus ostreatoroseus]|nr:hypothetical protein EIP86_010654 [Pleurotus ostreatoroseus]
MSNLRLSKDLPQVPPSATLNGDCKSKPNLINGTDTPGLEQNLKLGDFSIDEYRPFKVIIVGAGFSGIAAGIRFRQYIPNLQMVIYEQNEGIGGTWFTNKYPGLSCDIPSHCYQYTFEEKTDWSAYYAPGSEILEYMESVVAKYKLMSYVRLRHEMTSAKYNEDTGKWHVHIKRFSPEGYEEFEDTADMLFTGVGGLSRWKWPDIEGLQSFQGLLVHSAGWEVPRAGEAPALEDGVKLRKGWQEDVKDWGDKKVAVIGVGSSAIQIVPALQPKVAKLCNYVRGQTWLAAPFSSGKMADLLSRNPDSENYVFTEEEKRSFEDPAYYKEFRHALESDLNSVHQTTMRESAMQEGARAAFKANMIKRLAKKPWIADHLIPEFGAACRRLTPGPGYLEALCADNVDFVPKHIKRITERGIETVDGRHEEFDVIICATGYDASFLYPFPIIGRNGVDIRDVWTPHPVSYLSVAVAGFPNWFAALGPNAGVGGGSLLALIEQQVDYAAQAAMKMQRERLKSIEVKHEAMMDFDRFIDSYFPTVSRLSHG